MKVIIGTFLLLAISAEVRPAPPKAAVTTSNTNCVCGRKNVIKDKNKNNFEYSWMVALEDLTKKPKAPFCAGSVITERHVLTAAHCLFDAKKKPLLPANIEIVIGGYDLTKDKDANAQRLKVQKFIIHETYSAANKLNDIAILVTDKKITYNDFVAPVCMPTVPLKSNITKQVVKATGWGLSVDKIKKLREIDLTVSDHPGAAQIATYRKTAKDLCVADLGGPLVWMHPYTKKYTQVGLIGGDDEADECGTTKDLGINTDVTDHVCWIEKQILPWRGEAKTCHEI